jgi:hypothetical protein
LCVSTEEGIEVGWGKQDVCLGVEDATIKNVLASILFYRNIIMGLHYKKVLPEMLCE